MEEVIAALCLENGPLRSSGSQRTFPDPQLLAQALKANAISGPSLLTDLDHAALREELGIKVLGHRTSILHCIQDLRRRSSWYFDHVQINSGLEFSPAHLNAGFGNSMSSGNLHLPRSRQILDVERSSADSSMRIHPRVDSDTSPAPSRHHTRAAPALEYSSDPFEEGNILANTTRPEDRMVSKRQYSSESIGIDSRAALTSDFAAKSDCPTGKDIQNVRQAETWIIDESGRKRRRLDLSAPSLTRPMSSILPIENRRSLSENSDAIKNTGSHHTNNVESQTTFTKLLEPKKSSTMITDQQNPKEMTNIGVSYKPNEVEKDIAGTQSSEALTIVCRSLKPSVNLPSAIREEPHQLLSVRNPHHAYLGLRALAVDTIFYGQTGLGQEIQSDAKMEEIWCTDISQNSETNSFVMYSQPFASGLRRYVGSRIRYYLSRSRLNAQYEENQVVLIPYPDMRVQKHHQLSATVFKNSPTGFISLRIDRSKSVRKNHTEGFTGGHSDMFSLSFPQEEITSMNWEYLRKWGRQVDEDTILPVYGGSGSGGEYDDQTWQEMEDERRGLKAPASRQTNKHLSQAQVEQVLDAAEKEMIAQWENIKKPGLRRKAWSSWQQSRKKHNEQSRIDLYKRSLEHLKTRLFKIRHEIMETEWTSTKKLQTQCKSMEASIHDRERYLWWICVLKKKQPPSKMCSLPVTNSRATSNGKSDVKRSSENSDLDDFISEDDILSEVGSTMTTYITAESSDNEHRTTYGDSGTKPKIRKVTSIKDDEGDNLQDISSLPWHSKPTSQFKNPSMRMPDIIDLTQRSDSQSGETSPAKHLSSRMVPDLPSYNDHPFGAEPKKPTTFKRPLGASPTIVIDSDPMETPSEEYNEIFNLEEIDAIFKQNPDRFVMLKDRRRLLIWTINVAPDDLRNSIKYQVVNASLKEVRSIVWASLKVIARDEVMKLPGLDEQDSESRLRLASWYVCWTIPLKLSKKGIANDDLRTTMANEAGFLEFYEFLKQILPIFKSSAIDRSIKRERKIRELAPGEDQLDDLLSSPYKKRKYAVPENDQTVLLRASALLRVQERDQRQQLLKRRFQAMGASDEDNSKVIVNPGKHDDQSFIYLNPNISHRIQPHQIEGVQFLWREVIADHQGCLLAQTMGLGKTMQIITLLVTIAEAANSSEGDIRAQVPEDLRKSRTLILCPPALIENWWDEFLMWVPITATASIGELRKVTATLSVTERLWEIQEWQKEGGVLLLGFNTFRDLIQNKERKTRPKMLDDEQHEMINEALLKMPNIIVADEAHLAKTAGSGINVTLKMVRSTSRIALTGSPLANNLEEYHSLIDWIAPGYLGTSVEFKANYVERIQAGLWQESTTTEYRDSLKRLEALKEELAPKVHRADVTVLQGRLKEKQEFVIRVPLTPLQEQIYQVYIETMNGVSDERKSITTVWAWLAILRLLCNHPNCFRDRLLLKASPGGTAPTKSRKRKSTNGPILTGSEVTMLDDADALIDAPVSKIGISPKLLDVQLAPIGKITVPLNSISLSNKMQVLMDILKFSKEAGDKVLIFSHSIYTLNYVEMQLKDAHFTYSRIDGEVPTGSRQKITKDFNYEDTEVCLISTRAGGQGLNLFGANRVVIIDGHFNPTYEEQAVGRAYRIGQVKRVFVYHLMVGGTFEEALHNQSVFKQQLAKRVVDKKNPAPRAFRGLGEYLRPPRALDQKDLKPFEGKDSFVLDRLLAAQNE